MTFSTLSSQATPLLPAPTTVTRFGEIAIKYNPAITDLFNALLPQERVFIYYLFRASLPGNRIAAGQHHRHSQELIDLFGSLIENEQLIKAQQSNGAAFMTDVTTFFVYLWTNHGQYFVKEHVDEKRTPARIGLTHLTRESLEQALTIIGHDNPARTVTRLADSLFNTHVEPTLFVPDNLEVSAINFYTPDFTQADFDALPAHERSALNGYFDITIDANGNRTPHMTLCKIGGKFDQELSIAHAWLEKAYAHTLLYPDAFDAHLTESINHLMAFLHSGDEEDFKKHSIAWLKSSSAIDYCFGFIETYLDPKSYRGLFQAEITIKNINMKKLNALLPLLEKRLPHGFMREAIDTLPNASINTQIFAAGGLGPLSITAAYCLPNYEEIRSTHGSKQIIYPAGKSIAELINPHKYRTLFYLTPQAEWLEKNDRDLQLHKDIWSAHCILHETLGHGSGRLDCHTFKHGDNLTIGGITYQPEQRIAVTSENIQELLCGYDQALEELRAEIIALYTSIFMFDELAAQGLFGAWPEKIGKEKVIEQLIFDMAATGLRRLQNQPRNATTIAGAHDKANLVIMNYLIDGGGLALVEEQKMVDGASYTVLGFAITNMDKLLADITALLIRVQTIKSTGDGLDAKKLFGRYGDAVRDQRHIAFMKDNLAAIVGDLKVSAQLFPHLVPIHDANGSIIDVQATWPATIIEQWQEFKKLEMSRE